MHADVNKSIKNNIITSWFKKKKKT